MSRRPPALLFTIVALASCLIGYWWLLSREEQAQPLPGFAAWETEVLQPLADDKLTLALLHERLPDAELWLQPEQDGPHLWLREHLPLAGETWELEAEVQLSARQRSSLAAASGVRPGDAEQPQSTQLLEQLAARPIDSLHLSPRAEVPSASVAAEFGEPRLRLPLPEGEAWVYPQLGLTAHFQRDRLQLLHAVPRSQFGR